MISEEMKTTVKQYEEIVVAMDDPKIIQTALRLAYYMSMLDAALNDPLEDQDDQQELETEFADAIHGYTEAFQSLVNDKL